MVSTRAYPRSRGGTWGASCALCCGLGLPPPAGGNRLRFGCGDCKPGPIPARAGEPNAAKLTELAGKAYPRSRGGTAYP